MPDLHRTRMCMMMKSTGACKDGDACTYAHSPGDLRFGRSQIRSSQHPRIPDGHSENGRETGYKGRNFDQAKQLNYSGMQFGHPSCSPPSHRCPPMAGYWAWQPAASTGTSAADCGDPTDGSTDYGTEPDTGSVLTENEWDVPASALGQQIIKERQASAADSTEGLHVTNDASDDPKPARPLTECQWVVKNTFIEIRQRPPVDARRRAHSADGTVNRQCALDNSAS